MSFPPPPGLKQTPSSLPARPPPPAGTAAPSSSSYQPAYSAPPSHAAPGSASGGYGANNRGSSNPARAGGYSAFTAFQPRTVAARQPQPFRTSSPAVSTPPSAGYSTPTTTAAGYGSYYPQSQQTYQGGASYYGQPQYNDNTYGSTVPHIQNPFGNPGESRGKPYGRNDSGLDPDTEAQIAQWQSAYLNKDEVPAAGSRAPARRDGSQMNTSSANTPSGVSTAANSTPLPTAPGQSESTPATVVRSGGGQTWQDSSLLEWDPAHFRLFVGNLAGEVTDDSLLKAFAKYSSVQKARVIREKRTQKSKGYGFVSFSDGDDYFKAAREMQGKYIGSHPVLLRRATTEVRPVSNKNGKKNGGKGGSGGGHAGGKVKHDGVKKSGKTKGGLRILG